MTSSTASTATPTPHPFHRQVDEVKVSKHDLNSVIMDYLISEGYPEAAEKFALEANLDLQVDMDTIGQRVEIRNFIYEGDIQAAIEKINDLVPQLLDQDGNLHFYLRRLQLVQIIRDCRGGSIIPPQEFAMEHLAPRAAQDEQLRHDLERTMLLAICREDQLIPVLKELLDPNMRKDMAQRVNEAILQETGEKPRPKLFNLVKLRAWSEQKAREANKDLPDNMDLGLDPSSHGTGPIHGGRVPESANAETLVS